DSAPGRRHFPQIVPVGKVHESLIGLDGGVALRELIAPGRRRDGHEIGMLNALAFEPSVQPALIRALRILPLGGIAGPWIAIVHDPGHASEFFQYQTGQVRYVLWSGRDYASRSPASSIAQGSQRGLRSPVDGEVRKVVAHPPVQRAPDSFPESESAFFFALPDGREDLVHESAAQSMDLQRVRQLREQGRIGARVPRGAIRTDDVYLVTVQGRVFGERHYAPDPRARNRRKIQVYEKQTQRGSGGIGSNGRERLRRRTIQFRRRGSRGLE